VKEKETKTGKDIKPPTVQGGETIPKKGQKSQGGKDEKNGFQERVYLGVQKKARRHLGCRAQMQGDFTRGEVTPQSGKKMRAEAHRGNE